MSAGAWYSIYPTETIGHAFGSHGSGDQQVSHWLSGLDRRQLSHASYSGVSVLAAPEGGGGGHTTTARISTTQIWRA